MIDAINTSEPAKSNKNNIFKSKRKEIKKSFQRKLSKKRILKSKIKEIKEIPCDPILDRDEKIEEIKKVLYDSKNYYYLNQKKIIISQ